MKRKGLLWFLAAVVGFIIYWVKFRNAKVTDKDGNVFLLKKDDVVNGNYQCYVNGAALGRLQSISLGSDGIVYGVSADGTKWMFVNEWRYA